jgi:hypothetical protein
LTERDSIAAFVKGTLGCACPEEAFDSIEVSRGTEAGGFTLEARLVIGGRLLIYIARAHDGAAVQCLAAAGRRDRDAHGLNRFRLVVLLDDPGSRSEALADKFASAVGDDERAHIHAVDGASPLLAAVLKE